MRLPEREVRRDHNLREENHEAHTASPARVPARQETLAAIEAAPANGIDGVHRRVAGRRRRTTVHRLRNR
jgi:hypothetical protein